MRRQVNGKRWNRAAYLRVGIAVFLILATAGCAVIRAADRDRNMTGGRGTHLAPVQDRLEKGDFEGAINHYRNLLLTQPDTVRADVALFDLGLLYAHYGNRKKDLKKSSASFARMLRDCPDSPLAEEAKIWINLLEMLESAKQVDMELDRKQKLLQSEGMSPLRGR